MRRSVIPGAALLVMFAACPQGATAQVSFDGRAGIGAAFGGIDAAALSGLFAVGVGGRRFHLRFDVLANGGGPSEEWVADLALQVDVLRGSVRKPTVYLLTGIGGASPSSIYGSDGYALIVAGGGLQYPFTGVVGLFGELRGYFAVSPPPGASSFGTFHAGIRVGAP